MSLELIFGLIALFGVAAIGVPVAYAIITGVVVYLGGVRAGSCNRGRNDGSAIIRRLFVISCSTFHRVSKHYERWKHN